MPNVYQETSVETGDGTLHVVDRGMGETAVVLVHGLGGDTTHWLSQLEGLSADWRVVAFDQRGHGRSSRPLDGVYTVDALVTDLEVVRLALGIRKMVLVGHSMSGVTLTLYAGLHPDALAGLVYLDAVVDFPATLPREMMQAIPDWSAPEVELTAALAAVFDTMPGPLAREQTRRMVVESVRRMDPFAFGGLGESLFTRTFDRAAEFARFEGPSLAIEAAGVAYASKDLGLRRVEVADVSHWLQMDAPGEANRLLNAFLDELPSN